MTITVMRISYCSSISDALGDGIETQMEQRGEG